MSSRNNLFELIIARLDGEKVEEFAYMEYLACLVREGIGGFIIFGGRLEAVREAVGRLQSTSELPLFIASDIERGVGQQLVGATRFPPQMAVAAAFHEDETHGDLLHDMLKAVSEEAVYAGINMPLIPVLDLNTNPHNPIICTRAFSDDPVLTGHLGTKYVKVLTEMGLICCAKHFPGHGDTDIDSHMALPVINKSIKELEALEILPFREAIRAGVPSVMVGHLSVPSIDNAPASLSGKVVKYLRDEIGFDGLILPDALNMDALKGYGSPAVLSLKAGMDILLHPSDPYEAVAEIEAAIRSGILTEGHIKEALGRIRKYKQIIMRLPSETAPDFEANALLADKVYQRVVTELPGKISLEDMGRLPDLCVFAGECTPEILKELSVFFKRIIPIADSDSVAGEAVLAVFSDVRAWRGLSGVDDNTLKRIKAFTKRIGRVVVISFGSPYILGGVENANVKIAAYEATVDAVRNTLSLLTQGLECKGKLPVRMPNDL